MENKVDRTKNQVILEDGEIKVLLREDVQKKGYMSIDEAKIFAKEYYRKLLEKEKLI